MSNDITVQETSNTLGVVEVDDRIIIQEVDNTLQVYETEDPYIILTVGEKSYDLFSDKAPQLGGDLDYNDKGIKVTGQTVAGTNGDSVYLSSSDTWSLTNASSDTTCRGLSGLRISATEVLTRGIYITTGLTAGEIYYLSETAGKITTTKPTSTDSIVRIFAYALSATKLMVDPDQTYIKNV